MGISNNSYHWIVRSIIVCTALFQFVNAYSSVTKVDCINRNAARTGKGWTDKDWTTGKETVTQDAAPAKKAIKVADVILKQKAVQHPDEHVAMLCELRAPYVEVNALFVKQEGNPAYKGEFALINGESDTWRRRWYLRSYVNGHGYRVRVQFFGSIAKGNEAKATGASIACGVVYPLFPNAQSTGCEFVWELAK